MATQRIRFQLTAYDPNPSDVTLALTGPDCILEECKGSNISIEKYISSEDNGPKEIHMKVTPEPIAFVMKIIDGNMSIEFKGKWAEFEVEEAKLLDTPVPKVLGIETEANATIEVAAEPPVEPEAPAEPPAAVEPETAPPEAETAPPEPVAELPPPAEPERGASPCPTLGMSDGTTSMALCFKINFLKEDEEAQDVRLNWDLKDLSADEGAENYKLISQKVTERGREFVVAVTHPKTGEVFCIRGLVKYDRVTILNTDKFVLDHMPHYLSFYIKDPELTNKILADIEANPGSEIENLYKHGAFAQSIDIASFIPYVQHLDKNKQPIPTKDSEEDEHVKKGREMQKKAESEGKKNTGPPEPDTTNWSCGRVKWELPKEEKRFREVGKLSVPDFSVKEKGPNLQNVGKLKWGGFQADEPKEVPKEKPQVGKLKLTPFGTVPPVDSDDGKKSRKKKQ